MALLVNNQLTFWYSANDILKRKNDEFYEEHYEESVI